MERNQIVSMIEIWKKIPQLPKHEASNLGNIRHFKYGYAKAPKILYSGGYVKFPARKDGKYVRYLVHRCVLAAFKGLDIHNKKLFGCHKDDNPQNNMLDNLFIGTQKDNMVDCAQKGRTASGERNGMYGVRGGLNPCSKPISQYTLDGQFIQSFGAITEAKHIISPQSIGGVLKGRQKKAGGYIWKYLNE